MAEEDAANAAKAKAAMKTRNVLASRVKRIMQVERMHSPSPARR